MATTKMLDRLKTLEAGVVGAIMNGELRLQALEQTMDKVVEHIMGQRAAAAAPPSPKIVIPGPWSRP